MAPCFPLYFGLDFGDPFKMSSLCTSVKLLFGFELPLLSRNYPGNVFGFPIIRLIKGFFFTFLVGVGDIEVGV